MLFAIFKNFQFSIFYLWRFLRNRNLNQFLYTFCSLLYILNFDFFPTVLRSNYILKVTNMSNFMFLAPSGSQKSYWENFLSCKYPGVSDTDIKCNLCLNSDCHDQFAINIFKIGLIFTKIVIQNSLRTLFAHSLLLNFDFFRNCFREHMYLINIYHIKFKISIFTIA